MSPASPRGVAAAAPFRLVRHGDAGDRTGVILPGVGYPPSAPLLWYAGLLLREAGWAVIEVWVPEEADHTSGLWAELGERLRHPLGQRDLVVAKSESSRLAPLAAEREVPGIWLTPFLSEPSVADAFSRMTAPGLVVGAMGDPTWDVRVSARLHGMEVLQLPQADHLLHGPDVGRSLEHLTRIVDRGRALIRRL